VLGVSQFGYSSRRIDHSVEAGRPGGWEAGNDQAIELSSLPAILLTTETYELMKTEHLSLIWSENGYVIA